MKKRKELNVDFIGGQGPLTKEEEKAISDFIRSRKGKQSSAPKRGSRSKKSIAS